MTRDHRHIPFPLDTITGITAALPAAIRHSVYVNAAYYDDLRGRLGGLLIRFGNRLDADARRWVDEFVGHGEYGLVGNLGRRAEPRQHTSHR